MADLLARRHPVHLSGHTRHPSDDFDADGKTLAERVAIVVGASGTANDPDGCGQAVARLLFPDLLPYVVGTPATFGFATGNGRGLADNAPEVMLSMVAGTAMPSGLKPAVAEHLRQKDFPFVVPA